MARQGSTGHALRSPVGVLLRLALVAALGGCLISATEVFTIVIGDLAVIGTGSVSIDLNGNDTYKEHKDEIRVIERVGFTTQIDNLSGQEVILSTYFSAQPGLTNPATEAIRLFSDIPIPPGGRTITYEESLDLLLNFEQLQTVLEGGAITLYGTANDVLLLNDVTMIVTFTVGL